MVGVLSDLENEMLQQVPFDFMPEVDASKLIKPWYGCKEARMVSGYDPEKEVVICFVGKGEGDKIDIDSYRLITRPAPPYAAED